MAESVRRDRPTGSPRPPHREPSGHPTSPVAHRLGVLQRDVGNRAVTAILSVQRTGAEDVAQFKRYIAREDWAHAAWQLTSCTPAVMAEQIKRGLESWQRERLTEHAHHIGATAVVNAVTALDEPAAYAGMIRFLVFKRQWSMAAGYFKDLTSADARRLRNSLINTGGLSYEGLKEMILLNDDLKLKPGDAVKVDGKEHIVYEKEVRTDGTPTWRTNNPGALIRTTPYMGSIGNNENGLLIYPDETSGETAGRENLKFLMSGPKEGLPPKEERTLLDVMRVYAPLGHGKNDPDAYAKIIADALGGGVTPTSRVQGFSSAQRETMLKTIVRTETLTEGKKLPRDSPDLKGLLLVL